MTKITSVLTRLFFIPVTGSAGQALQRSGALCSSRIPLLRIGHGLGRLCAFASPSWTSLAATLRLCFPDMKKDGAKSYCSVI